MLFSRSFQRHCGFTVLELLISLTIGIIAASFAIPAIGNYSDSLEFRTERDRLTQLLQTARTSAVSLNSFMVACHLDSGECKDFSSPITVFTDTNDNRRLDPDESTTAIYHFNSNAFAWWNKTNRIRFAPNGRALNGSLSYCWIKPGDTRGFKIIIARTGRMRTDVTNSHCR